MAGPNTTVSDLEVTGNLRATSFLDGSATIGAATANTIRGRNTIANGASTVVITNSLVTAASTILAVIETSTDATLKSINAVTPAAGSFTVTGNSAATSGNVTFSWVVIN